MKLKQTTILYHASDLKFVIIQLLKEITYMLTTPGKSFSIDIKKVDTPNIIS